MGIPVLNPNMDIDVKRHHNFVRLCFIQDPLVNANVTTHRLTFTFSILLEGQGRAHDIFAREASRIHA